MTVCIHYLKAKFLLLNKLCITIFSMLWCGKCETSVICQVYCAILIPFCRTLLASPSCANWFWWEKWTRLRWTSNPSIFLYSFSGVAVSQLYLKQTVMKNLVDEKLQLSSQTSFMQVSNNPVSPGLVINLFPIEKDWYCLLLAIKTQGVIQKYQKYKETEEEGKKSEYILRSILREWKKKSPDGLTIARAYHPPAVFTGIT